jgi:glycosyltransferase involved in cell wall biosynthesis
MTTKLALILMVKNEEKILARCLAAVKGLVDCVCICDTGSTDTTCEIAQEYLKTNEGSLSKTTWRDFGHNRTLSFEAAQTYIRDILKWDLKTTYGLLLDADMVFVPGTLKTYPLTELGYTVIQSAGNLEYPNCRVIRMDFGWKCRGVTHEYWDGPTIGLPKSVCYIDDRNDGGSKADKFQRDARLLEKGLKDEPDNVRYMFYLAQTYHSLGRWKESIAMYKKRIAAGGWVEEQWYSMYMIGQCYLALEDPIRFEGWMLRAYKFRPGRAESLYKLARYFREVSQHYKSYGYVRMGKGIPLSTDSLFIEKDVYTGLFDYESTILNYYVSTDRIAGLRESTQYLLTSNNENVLSNLKFYAQPIGKGVPLDIPRHFFGPDYHPGSVCMWTDNGEFKANVRYVNYRLDPATRSIYEMSENGVYTTNHTVRTQNAWYSKKTGELRAMKDESVILPRRPVHIRGLEDVRVFPKEDGLYFTATTLEYSPKIRILHGKYLPESGEYKDCRILESPTGQDCEKNWLGVPYTDDMIYNWHPLQVGVVRDSGFEIHTKHTTPPFFTRMRGSAPPFRMNNELWTLTHFVEYSAPRKYYHTFVVLDTITYKPLRMSLPFVFEEATVEYCLGACLTETGITCVYSSMDDNPRSVVIPPTHLHWISL